MGKYTSSTKRITEKTLELYDRIVDKKLLTRRLTITANRLLSEEEAKNTVEMEQLSLFDDPKEILQKEEDEAKEKRRQQAILSIKNRFGPNSIMKGTSYQDAATGIERNKTVGGHHE